jgi:hypothetical protein
MEKVCQQRGQQEALRPWICSMAAWTREQTDNHHFLLYLYSFLVKLLLVTQQLMLAGQQTALLLLHILPVSDVWS